MNELNWQQIFIPIITVVGFFGVLWRTWIKPNQDRQNRIDNLIVEMQSDIKYNTERAAEHEAECKDRMTRLYGEIKEIKKEITAIKVEIAEIKAQKQS